MKAKKIIYICIAMLILFSLALTYKSRHQYTVEDFIFDKKIVNPTVIKLKNKSYIFSKKNIFVFRNKSSFEIYKDSSVRDYIIGGLEKGSVGVIMTDPALVKKVKYYTVEIANEEKEHKIKYIQDNCLVITDERIWNPNPTLKITLLDKNKSDIAVLNF